MDIEVQNMDLKHWKICFEVHTLIFEGCFKTKMTFKNILEYSRIILARFHIKFRLFLKKIDKAELKSRDILYFM